MNSYKIEFPWLGLICSYDRKALYGLVTPEYVGCRCMQYPRGFRLQCSLTRLPKTSCVWQVIADPSGQVWVEDLTLPYVQHARP